MSIIISLSGIFITAFNLFQANDQIMQKPGGWFLLAKCGKHLGKSDILSKVAGHGPLFMQVMNTGWNRVNPLSASGALI